MKILVACILLLIALPMGCNSSGNHRHQYPVQRKTENIAQKGQPLSQYVEYAYLSLEQEKAKYGLTNPREQLIFRSEHIDTSQKKHVKFRQVHKNIPVWGREIIVHLDESNSIYRVSGKILAGLSALSTQPAIALGEAKSAVMQASQWGGQGWRIKNHELCVLSQNGSHYLAFQLTVVKSLLRAFIFVNANNGVIIHSTPGTHIIK